MHLLRSLTHHMLVTRVWALRTGLVAGVFALLAGGVHALMAPSYEARAALERIERAQSLRSQAPDVVELEIGKVQVQHIEADQCPSREAWKVEARVVGLSRGTLAVGDAVNLVYERTLYRCPGPIHEPVPMLQPGQRVSAYLRCTAAHMCTPAAEASSFTDEPGFAHVLAERRDEWKQASEQQASANQPSMVLQRHRVFFFRRASTQLAGADRAWLQRHAGYLAGDRGRQVRVISFAEHGLSREAALALSERRGAEVRRILVTYGASPLQVAVVALGIESRPQLPTQEAIDAKEADSGGVLLEYAP